MKLLQFAALRYPSINVGKTGYSTEGPESGNLPPGKVIRLITGIQQELIRGSADPHAVFQTRQFLVNRDGQTATELTQPGATTPESVGFLKRNATNPHLTGWKLQETAGSPHILISETGQRISINA
ncbi:MAG: hypothetical protein K2X01_05170 [Cyanobacteria bacterium]|nr:hypothetical protein [Cyanobacteriota bacterium]